MHIRRIEIENIKVIKHLIWELSEEQNGAGWHVILGDNGSGKTSFVRAVALGCLNEQDRGYISFHPINLMRNLSTKSFSNILASDQNKNSLNLSIRISRVSSTNNFYNIKFNPNNNPLENIYNDFFIMSFGAVRKFNGNFRENERINKESRIASRHITAFSEKSGMTEAFPWLQNLRFQELEQDEIATRTLQRVRNFVTQTGFLAHSANIPNLVVSSKGVSVTDVNGTVVPAEEMSDGYRSVLSLTFELIRQLVDCFGVDKVFDPEDATKIIAPGVVQIDEVDAHLHPTWQHRIGEWFTTHFPNIQFIVTTHSPIICQAADTVFKLPTPGTDEVGEFVTGNNLLRLKYGSVSEAYGTGVFGVGVERSEEAKGLLEELAGLNIKELDEDLTDEEIERQEFLRGLFPSSASVGLSRRRAR